MAIYHQDIADIELNSGSLHRSFLNHSIGLGDAAANRFGVRVFRDGAAETLSGVTCQGFFRNANGENIALTSYGTIDGNVAYVTLPQACYNVEGMFTLAIKLVGGGVTGTMRIIDGVVDNTNTGSAVAPTGSVPTYQEVLSVYEQMQDALDDYADVVAAQNGQIDDLKSAFVGGTTGQLLRKHSNADLDLEWSDFGQPTDEQTAAAVSDWLDEHPEATTTVQNKSLGVEKFTDEASEKILNATRNALIGFITPSYGTTSYQPTKYALGISYDGVTFNQIEGTENCAGDFLGGNDAMITKIGDDYICIANSDLNTLRPESLNTAVEYVVTKDFKTFSAVKYFDGYSIGTYLMNTYGVTEDFASRRQWEPSLFFDNNENLYLTLSGGYAPDAHYPADCYYHDSNSVFIRYFKQLYMRVSYDAETQTLNPVAGETIHEFAFPSGVESVIDVQVISKDEGGYWYLYKDRVTNTCHIASMSSLSATPANVVEYLYGSTFCENPYMIEFGDYKLIYVTYYFNGLESRDGHVIKARNDLTNFEAVRYDVNGNIMKTGTKCRSLHPIVMDDVSILNYFENECGVCIGATTENSSNALAMVMIDQLAVYYGIPQSLSSNIVYTVPSDCTILIDTRWTHNNGLLLFKTQSGNAVNIALNVYGTSITSQITLSRFGSLELYSIGARQQVILGNRVKTKRWTFTRNDVTCDFYYEDLAHELYYVFYGTNAGTRAAGNVTSLTAVASNIPDIITDAAVLSGLVGNNVVAIKLDKTNMKLIFIYPTGASANDAYVGSGVIYIP